MISWPRYESAVSCPMVLREGGFYLCNGTALSCPATRGLCNIGYPSETHFELTIVNLRFSTDQDS